MNKWNGRVKDLTLVEKAYLIVLLVIFGGIVLHAPLSVGLGSLFPGLELVGKSWKEVLMGVAGLLLLVILIKKRAFGLLKEPVVLLIAAFAALHLIMLTIFWQGAAASLAGLVIDLRYLFYFVLVYVGIRLYPAVRRPFLAVGLAGALIVLVFAVLQAFVLPPDILKYIGYNDTTIVPYLTVDQNQDFIRINSTLRGPNPLGAYAVIVLSLVLALWIKGRQRQFRRPLIVTSIITVGGVVALLASYSRSALAAAIVAIGIVVGSTVARKLSARTWIMAVVIVTALIGGVIAVGGSSFVSNVILHENPGESNNVNSNDGHLESLRNGADRFVRQPFGAGVGSTGSASLYSERPVIIENQYLFIAHETGWLGLLLFTAILGTILAALWVRRRDWLALGTFASGIGLLLIGLLLPVWVDETVAIVWWGLAALATGGRHD